MKQRMIAIPLLGLFSLLAGAISLLSSCITFHPKIQESANRFIAITATVWIGSLLLTLGLSLTAVQSASDHDLAAARSLKHRGLAYCLPQIAVVLVLLVWMRR